MVRMPGFPALRPESNDEVGLVSFDGFGDPIGQNPEINARKAGIGEIPNLLLIDPQRIAALEHLGGPNLRKIALSSNLGHLRAHFTARRRDQSGEGMVPPFRRLKKAGHPQFIVGMSENGQNPRRAQFPHHRGDFPRGWFGKERARPEVET